MFKYCYDCYLFIEKNIKRIKLIFKKAPVIEILKINFFR